MKKLLLLTFLVGAITACAPRLSNEFINGFWCVEQDTCVKYTFRGHNTMFIDSDDEGEEYVYHIKDDTLIFMPIFDTEVLGDSTCKDTMIINVIDYNRIELKYLNIKFNLIRLTE